MSLTVDFGGLGSSKFALIWLRDHCRCVECFHPLTKQRLQNTFAIPYDLACANVKNDGSKLTVDWSDGHHSIYSLDWLAQHSYDPKIPLSEAKSQVIEKRLWQPQDLDLSNLVHVDFAEVMAKDSAVGDWTRHIFEHGFCMITNVPVSPLDTQKLVERLAYIQHTHYGGFWDFTADLAHHDTAYTNMHLACHTDGTYWTYTPGLQLFHMLKHEGTGGENMLCDAFKCADILRAQDPLAYELLSTIAIPAHSAGNEHVCITPTAPMPVFNHDGQGQLVQVRWNNDDRSAMANFRDCAEAEQFYEALRKWNQLILDNEIVVKLRPGTCLIFDNWRVLHGRKAFTGSRRMCGAYIARDDFVSRFRLLNMGRDAVLNGL